MLAGSLSLVAMERAKGLDGDNILPLSTLSFTPPTVLSPSVSVLVSVGIGVS